MSDGEITRDTPLNFGKFRDVLLSDVPDQYLRWIVGTFDNDDDWLDAARKELNYREDHGIMVDDPTRGKSASKPKPASPKADPTVPGLRVTPQAIDGASLLLFDRYLKARKNWPEPPGFYTWLVKLLDSLFDGGKDAPKFEQKGSWDYVVSELGAMLVICHSSNSGAKVATLVKVKKPGSPIEARCPEGFDAPAPKAKPKPASMFSEKGESERSYEDYATSLPPGMDDFDRHDLDDAIEASGQEPPF